MNKVLIANRGEVALRVIRSCRQMGIASLVVHSDAESSDMHVTEADQSELLSLANNQLPYLDQKALIDCAKRCDADAIHPGYGFLSERASFAKAVEEAGLIFVGPRAETLRLLGSKNSARDYVASLGIKTIPGYSGEKQDLNTLSSKAKEIGTPLMIKASEGGGGRGMRRVYDLNDFKTALDAAKREAKSLYDDQNVILERVISPARHIEVQVIGDGLGNVLHLFERECSLQRRFQKVIEEAPARDISNAVRNRLHQAALLIAKSLKLRNASTIEFLLDHKEEFFFLEANPRLQVEHPVTEMVTGVDIVELQLQIARGEALPFKQDQIKISGAASEARVYAEIPEKEFQVSTGEITDLKLPSANEHLRLEHAISKRTSIGPNFDPLLVKIIAHGKDLTDSRAKLRQALKETSIAGIGTNTRFLIYLLDHFSAENREQINTSSIDSLLDSRSFSEVISKSAALAIEVFSSIASNYQARIKPQQAESSDPFYGGSVFSPAASIQQPSISTELNIQYLLSSPALSEPILFHYKAQQQQIDLSDHSSVIRTFNQRSNEAARLSIDITIDGSYFSVKPIQSSSSEQETQWANQIVAPLTGKVLSVYGTAGDSFKKGDVLATIESMKMEHSVKAARNLKIAEVLTTADQSIEGDAVMFRLEEDIDS